MPESPDFSVIARGLVDAYDPVAMEDRGIAIDIAEQLRLVWNARGAADLAKIDLFARALRGVNVAGDAVKIFDPAIRELDR